MIETVLLAEPRGFCAGVEMAIRALTVMVGIFDPPVYCYHHIVHNAGVVKTFKRAGVIFVDSIHEVPKGAVVMLSAHGSTPDVVALAEKRAAIAIDTVCPLVTKVHHEARKRAADGYEIIYVGHAGHDEALGTMGEAPEAITLVEPEAGLGTFVPRDTSKVALLAQTTLGVHEWEDVLREAKERFPALWTPRKGDLCYATTNRQTAVRELARRADLVLVVGSETSSNTNALARAARDEGSPAYRIDGVENIDPQWLDGARIVGVTSGASVPDSRVDEVINYLVPKRVELVSIIEEGEFFPFPPALRDLLHVLQSVVEAGVTARTPGLPGFLEDRSVSADQALSLL